MIKCDMNKDKQNSTVESGARKSTVNAVIGSLVSGSLSSVVTTIVYQPLELLKTRIQIQDLKHAKFKNNLFGRVLVLTSHIRKHQGALGLWQGTGASLLRSVPGVGMYYALLNILQSNYSTQLNRPDTAAQAFYFGLIARSSVSFVLLPITVIKVRYESGLFKYPSLGTAIKQAYSSKLGWVGLAPTIMRDSLFSGTYYMSYTQLKLLTNEQQATEGTKPAHLRNFTCGILSGILASIVTNPIDVLKTNIQVTRYDTGVTMRQIATKILGEPRGYLRFFDGLGPRSVRRTLISATTWTFYEFIIDTVKT